MKRHSIILSAVALVFTACGGGGGDMTGDVDGGGVGGSGSCPAYVVPSGTDLMQPAVSFKNDVMRLFNNSCGLSSCHGAMNGAQGGLFLGAESAMRGDAATVYGGLVGRPSGELPSMPFVTAGDPAKSYIMHKLDGDQCQFDRQCNGGTCMALMPAGGNELLPVATRDLLRRWIAQGAENN